MQPNRNCNVEGLFERAEEEILQREKFAVAKMNEGLIARIIFTCHVKSKIFFDVCNSFRMIFFVA